MHCVNKAKKIHSILKWHIDDDDDDDRPDASGRTWKLNQI